jgi:hypothetical protein
VQKDYRGQLVTLELAVKRGLREMMDLLVPRAALVPKAQRVSKVKRVILVKKVLRVKLVPLAHKANEALLAQKVNKEQMA